MAPLPTPSTTTPTGRSPKKPVTPKSHSRDVVPMDLATPSQIRADKSSQSRSIATMPKVTTSDIAKTSLVGDFDNSASKKRITDVILPTAKDDERDEERPRKVQRTEDVQLHVPNNTHTRKPRPKPAASLVIPKKVAHFLDFFLHVLKIS